MEGKLWIVPTPIGNLGDMSPRAVSTLREADLILAEDTRTTSILTKHFDINTPLQSHHKYNEHSAVDKLIDKIEKGMKIALVSDAGTPGISDPGFLLSRQCKIKGIEVECLPGPTAFVPALVASGLPCDRFVFEGFLPVKKGRATRLKELSLEDRTIVIYESPKRLDRTLRQLTEYFGEEREAAVCRELTKLHEEIRRGSLGELSSHYSSNQAKGEIVIIIGAKLKKDKTLTSNKITHSYNEL